MIDSMSDYMRCRQTVAALENVGSPVATVLRHQDGRKGTEGKAESIQVEGVVPYVSLHLLVCHVPNVSLNVSQR